MATYIDTGVKQTFRIGWEFSDFDRFYCGEHKVDNYRSPIVFLKEINAPEFRIIINPNKSSIYLGIYIELKSQICDQIKAYIKISYNPYRGSTYPRDGIDPIFVNILTKSDQSSSSKSRWQFGNTRSEEQYSIPRLIIQNLGYLVCEGTVQINKKKIDEIVIPNCCALENLAEFFNNGKFSDVALAVDGIEIPAHKMILAAQSPVFAAMFEHEMMESNQNRVVIVDIGYEVVKEMLLFIYTGHAPSIDKMTEELLAAADKYALERLKAMCEKSLFNNISPETACHTLYLARLHSAKQLKENTLNYISDKSNFAIVMETDAWKDKTNSHPHVIIEALQAIAMKQQSTSAVSP